MISVLLSSYKSNLDYLKEQIDSIINQTEKDWELLIYNDGTENLPGFIEQMGYCCLPNVHYYAGEHLGYVGVFNFLFKEAKGEYVCICDHDDIWELDKLKVQKKYLDEHPDVDCVFGWLKWFGEKNKLESFSISDEQISKDLYFYQPIKNPTVMFRKNRFGFNDCPFEKASDFWFWAKHKDRHYHLIEKVLVNYRRHSGEMTKDKSGFREGSARVIQESFKTRFGRVLPLEVCRDLDIYSKTYNDCLLRVLAMLI